MGETSIMLHISVFNYKVYFLYFNSLKTINSRNKQSEGVYLSKGELNREILEFLSNYDIIEL